MHAELSVSVLHISDCEAMRSLPSRETTGKKHRGVYCRPRGSWWRLRLPPAQPERRLLQRVPTWPLAAGRSPSANPPPACKRDMAARRAAVGRRAGVFLFFLLAIYYFYLECLGGQYSSAAAI